MKRDPQQHRISKGLLVLYLGSLAAFVFFPRPVLESGDPSAIAEFLRTHANLFYKILYADARVVALANYLMLTPFVVIIHFAIPTLRKRTVAITGIILSLIIEIIQLFIPGRVSDIKDFWSNSISVLIGSLIVRFIPRK